jgi:hypothetical protein
MTVDRTSRLLLSLYPAGWRARYGEELEALIVEASGGRVTWRVRFDVARAAGRERLRSAGLAGDGPPRARMRAGSLLVLYAWALFVVAGIGTQKVSEHWQASTPVAGRSLPSTAFDVLIVGAAIGSALVVIGIAAALPSAVRFLRGGGWRCVRRPVLLAGALTFAAALAAVPIVVWAHRLSAAQRNGLDAAYGVGAGLWALLLVACLVAWTAAAVAVARRIDLPSAVMRLETLLATAVTLSMAAMTAATVVWWAALDQVAASYLVTTALMLIATAVAAAGSVGAVRGLVASSLSEDS